MWEEQARILCLTWSAALAVLRTTCSDVFKNDIAGEDRPWMQYVRVLGHTCTLWQQVEPMRYGFLTPPGPGGVRICEVLCIVQGSRLALACCIRKTV